MSADHTAHESIIKTPRQLIIVIVLAFVVPVILLIALAQFAVSISGPDAGALTSEAVAARIKPVAEVTVSVSDVTGAAKSGEGIVQSMCSACHATGAANAPKLGDKAAWAARISRGLNALVQSAIKGKGAMPPKGGASDLSDYEITRAIVYMANVSGASFKEPPAPRSPARK